MKELINLLKAIKNPHSIILDALLFIEQGREDDAVTMLQDHPDEVMEALGMSGVIMVSKIAVHQ